METISFYSLGYIINNMTEAGKSRSEKLFGQNEEYWEDSIMWIGSLEFKEKNSKD